MREIIGYRLVVDVIGPGVRERIEREVGDLLELQPKWVDHSGYSFERYEGDDGDFIEIRMDYIITRAINPIYREIIGKVEAVKPFGPTSSLGMTKPHE
jgi:hypothetical protein